MFGGRVSTDVLGTIFTGGNNRLSFGLGGVLLSSRARNVSASCTFRYYDGQALPEMVCFIDDVIRFCSYAAEQDVIPAARNGRRMSLGQKKNGLL